MKVKCFSCKKELKLKPSRVRNTKNHYCNRVCMSKGYRLKYEQTKTQKQSCLSCGKPVYKNPYKGGKQRFCGMSCYKKWRGDGPSAEGNCVICGQAFRKSPGSKRVSCSKECGYIFISRTGTTLYECLNCGGLVKRHRSKSYTNGSYCSSGCYSEHNKLQTSFSWKGGWYKHSNSKFVMILIGKYRQRSTSRHKPNLKYKARHRVLAEEYLGYDLVNSCRVLMLNNSEMLKNLYLCNISEYNKIYHGSIEYPKTSNLLYVKQKGLFKAKKIKYIRFPSDWIAAIMTDSFKAYNQKQSSKGSSHETN